jgi:hypothetical protein
MWSWEVNGNTPMVARERPEYPVVLEIEGENLFSERSSWTKWYRHSDLRQ